MEYKFQLRFYFSWNSLKTYHFLNSIFWTFKLIFIEKQFIYKYNQINLKIMEVSKFSLHMKYLSTNGVTLHTEEMMNMFLALRTLQFEMKFEELLFWGKIEGK